MNCDQAFESLTDPARRSRADLTEHLAACPRCRDMADALEPALDLFHDTLPAEHVHGGGQSADLSLQAPSDAHQHPAPAAVLQNAAWPEAPWRTESSQSRHLRRLTWPAAVGMASLLSLLAAILWLQLADDRFLAGTAVRQDCVRTTAPDAPPSAVVSGCVACHTLDKTISLIAADRHAQVRTTLARCVACHTSPTLPASELDTAEPAPGTANPLLLACEFGG